MSKLSIPGLSVERFYRMVQNGRCFAFLSINPAMNVREVVPILQIGMFNVY